MFADRYDTTKILKEGKESKTLLATERASGDPVIIKQLPSASAALRERLEYEAESLRKVRSPLWASVLQIEVYENRLYLIRRYVSGTPLSARLQNGPLLPPEAVAVGKSLLAALRVAHERGVFHHNLKPTNVILGDGPSPKSAVLTDFGLAYTPRQRENGAEIPIEVAWYLSPEQAGLLVRDLGAGADLYSVGVLLFQCLSGRLPFEGETIGALLRKHLSEPPPRLRSASSAVPRALDELIQRLLRKEARDRYQTAEGVEADLAQIGDALAGGEIEPKISIGARDRRDTLTDPAFVGREREFAALDALLAQVKKGKGGLVLLEGGSGEGKSRLLQEFAEQAAQEGARVSRGTGADQTAPRPFQLLEEIARELVMAARSDPPFAEELRNRLSERRDILLSLLPGLGEILGPAPAQVLGPEQYVETRGLTALGAFLDALGSPSRPIILLMDDSQWADELTIRSLRYWRRQQGAGESPDRFILIVVAFRSEEVPEDHLLRTIPPSSHILLRPFQDRDLRALIESMAGAVPEEAHEAVARLAQGSPFLAAAALRGLVETGALTPEPGGWRVHPEAMAEARSSDQAALFLARRLERLPKEARRFLSAGAILGKRFDPDLAVALTGQEKEAASAFVKEAAQRQILWTDPRGECAFVHDKLRETLLAQLPETERRNLHGEAARRIERADRKRSFELSYHFSEAGAWGLAFPYALAAAEEARRQHALEVAERHYRIAEQALGERDRPTSRRVAEGLADVLMLRGRYGEALERFERVRALVENEIDRAKIDGKLGELFFKKGDVHGASEAIQRALQCLGHRIPRRSASMVSSCLWEAVVQMFHTFFPRIFLSRRATEGAEKELLAVRLFSRLAYVWWFERGSVPCLWAHLRETNLAERYPPTPELGQAYSNHAPAMILIPYFSRGKDYAERSLAIRRRLKDLWGEGQTLSFYGVLLYADSKFQETLERCREAFRLLDRTGDRWEAHVALFHVAASLYRMGDFRGAIDVCRRVYQLGQELGETHASALSVEIWSMASGGRVSESIIADVRSRAEGDLHTLQNLKMAEAVCSLGNGKISEAILQFEEAEEITRKGGLRNEYVVPTPIWLAGALRLQMERTPAYDLGQRRALMRRARAALRRGRRLSRLFQNSLPHALREEGLLAAIRGKTDYARKCFDRSLKIAERQGARYEYARSLLTRGKVGRASNWPGARNDLDEARHLLGAFGALPDPEDRERPALEPEAAPLTTLSLADRFSALQDAGRRIASALSREAVFTALREAILVLLRGEDCLMMAPPPPDSENAPGDPLRALQSAAREDPLRQTLIERARQDRRPAAYAYDPLEKQTEGLLSDQIRSALCGLIYARGEVAACFYTTHRQVSGLFGREEIRLAEFLSVLAGAALENAEGFSKIEAFSKELERRVDERTAALRETNRELETFVYTASHDLKTPVISLEGLTSILIQDYGERLDERGKQYLRRIISNCRFMEQLIADLLEFSRVGRRRNRIELLKTEAIVREVVDQCNGAIERSGTRVQVNAPLPDIWFDAVDLKQLFLNLIGNGVKFMGDQPRPVIEVGGREADGFAEFYVKDNGIGVDPEYHEKVFVIFHRLNDVEVEGTGVGLAIVKKIIDMAGGKVWLESRKGEGATFFFRIPRRSLSAPAETKKTSDQ